MHHHDHDIIIIDQNSKVPIIFITHVMQSPGTIRVKDDLIFLILKSFV